MALPEKLIESLKEINARGPAHDALLAQAILLIYQSLEVAILPASSTPEIQRAANLWQSMKHSSAPADWKEALDVLFKALSSAPQPTTAGITETVPMKDDPWVAAWWPEWVHENIKWLRDQFPETVFTTPPTQPLSQSDQQDTQSGPAESGYECAYHPVGELVVGSYDRDETGFLKVELMCMACRASWWYDRTPAPAATPTSSTSAKPPSSESAGSSAAESAPSVLSESSDEPVFCVECAQQESAHTSGFSHDFIDPRQPGERTKYPAWAGDYYQGDSDALSSPSLVSHEQAREAVGKIQGGDFWRVTDAKDILLRYITQQEQPDCASCKALHVLHAAKEAPR